MLIFIDDSGDPGFKFGKGSTRYFVVLLLIFDDESSAEQAIVAIKKFRNSLNFNNTEFKFQKSSREVRTKFLKAVNKCKFRINTLVIDKTKIERSAIPTEISFYQYAIEKAIKNPQFSVVNAKIWIDGSGPNVFKKNFISQLRKRVNNMPEKIIKRCTIADSKNQVI